MSAFGICFERAVPHGVLVGVSLPGTGESVPDDIVGTLMGAEQRVLESLRGFRREEWVGGRLALHQALDVIGGPHQPLLSGEGGEVVAPRGWSVSVSHKRELAVGIASRAHGGSVGIDLETAEPQRLSIAPKVLRPEELELVEGLPESRRWVAVLERFTLKEAFYKAVYPFVRRFVGFQEVAVHPDLDGSATFESHMEDGPFEAFGRTEWFNGYVVATVRVERG